MIFNLIANHLSVIPLKIILIKMTITVIIVVKCQKWGEKYSSLTNERHKINGKAPLIPA